MLPGQRGPVKCHTFELRKTIIFSQTLSLIPTYTPLGLLVEGVLLHPSHKVGRALQHLLARRDLVHGWWGHGLVWLKVMPGEIDVSVGDVGMWRLLHGGSVCWWGRRGAVWVHVADGRRRGRVHGLPIGICPCVGLIVLLLLGGAASLLGLAGCVAATVVGLVLVVVWVVWVVGMLAAGGTDLSIRGLDGTEMLPPAVGLGNQRSILHLMEECAEPFVTGQAVAAHEGPLAHPQVLATDPHKVLKRVLPPRFLCLLGVSPLDITQLEAGEEVGILEVEVTQVPEVVEDLEHLGPHALPALEGTVAGRPNHTRTHHLSEAVDVLPARVSVQLDALPLLLQLVDGLFTLPLDVVH